MRPPHLVALLPALVAVCLSAQTPQVTVPDGFLVVDSNGTEVGLVTDMSETRVALVVDGITLVPAFDSTGLIVESAGFPHFTGSDCTGTAYLGKVGRICEETGGLMTWPGWTVYRLTGPPADPPVQLLSYRDNGGCHAAASMTQSFQRPAVVVLDLRALFVPPFSIVPFVIDEAHCVRRKLTRAN